MIMNKLSSAFSDSSSTSSQRTNTIYGLGTLTGKALEAFGEATLRVVENLTIRRKLVYLRSSFPHTNDNKIADIDQLYDDLLELLRSVMDSLKSELLHVLNMHPEPQAALPPQGHWTSCFTNNY
jgi:hypothetical protein